MAINYYITIYPNKTENAQMWCEDKDCEECLLDISNNKTKKTNETLNK